MLEAVVLLPTREFS